MSDDERDELSGEPCSGCDGTGWDDVAGEVCFFCDGSGWVE